jgi:Fe-S cluster assembly iron-binding protein IscA
MLGVTPRAAQAIRDLLTDSGFADEAGLRLSLEKPANGTEPEFALAVASEPGEADEVVEADGARVFLEPAARAYFDDKVLDADGDVFTFAPAGASS